MTVQEFIRLCDRIVAFTGSDPEKYKRALVEFLAFIQKNAKQKLELEYFEREMLIQKVISASEKMYPFKWVKPITDFIVSQYRQDDSSEDDLINQAMQTIRITLEMKGGNWRVYRCTCGDCSGFEVESQTFTEMPTDTKKAINTVEMMVERIIDRVKDNPHPYERFDNGNSKLLDELFKNLPKQ